MTDRTISSDSSSSWSSEDQQRKHRPRKSPLPLPEIKVMSAIKRHFHGHRSATFQVVPEAPTFSSRAQVLNGSISELEDTLSVANKAGALVGMCINRTNGKGRKEVAEIKAVWVDIDGGFDPKNFRHLKSKPALIVETSPGRGHVFFDVSGCSVEFYPYVQRALAEKFGGDLNVTDPGRAVRLGGTLHHKDGPHPTRLIYLAKKYKPTPVKKLIARLGLTINQPPRAPSMETSVEARVRSAVACIQSSDERRYWLKIGMAIHDALPNDIGLRIWNDWSMKSPKFNRKDQERTWAGFRSGSGRTVASLFKEAMKHGWNAKTTDASVDWDVSEFGLVDRFAQLAEDALCFDAGEKRWLAFNSPVWRVDDPLVMAQARRIHCEMTRDAEMKGDGGALALLKKYASVPSLRTLLNSATSSPALYVQSDQFDAQPHLLAVANGVVDLMTGELLPGEPEQLLRRQASVAFDASATAPTFSKFIEFVTRGDREYADYLQRALGYSLFGHSEAQIFFWMVGSGANGKGVLIRRLQKVLGDLLVTIQPNLLTNAYSGNPNSPTPAFMALHGARVASCSEGQEGKRFDSAFVKQITGNDQIAGRPGYGAQTQFSPVCTLWISANSVPDVDSQDKAMWRRLQILPFKATAKAKVKQEDPQFEARLDGELPGILNWLLAGARMYLELGGVGSCNAVDKANRRAFTHGDSVQTWIKERCDADRSSKLQATLAFQDYSAHCKRSGRLPLSVQAFNKAMKGKGYRIKKTKRFNVYVGLSVTGS
ncbi:MAG: PriCT-2 domain-containing protein [Rhizobacter sp.]|nr:PriCT-2 domain-containing protein [Rhizobacter sp.]